MRKQVIAANWKMNKTSIEAKDFVERLKLDLGQFDKADIIICPPFTGLAMVGNKLSDTNYRLGAQNMYWEVKGAYTGEISAEMLREIGCQHVIIGHSERRQYFSETDEIVNKKIKAAFDMGLMPIMCIGETLSEREAGSTFSVLERQANLGLSGLSVSDKLNPRSLIIAYEPIWAIGTGKNATSQQAQEAQAFIRSVIAKAFGADFAEEIRIQYGGSVKPENAKEILKQNDVDGALVGGASLKADMFAKIVKASK